MYLIAQIAVTVLLAIALAALCLYKIAKAREEGYVQGFVDGCGAKNNVDNLLRWIEKEIENEEGDNSVL